MSLYVELKRKHFHLNILFYLGGYEFFGRETALWILGFWGLFVGVVEWGRFRYPDLNSFLLRIFGGIHRKEEVLDWSGVPFATLGCWILMALEPDPDIVRSSVLFLIFGDMAAALVGKRFGRHKLPGVLGWPDTGKTWEGFLACWGVCWCLGIFFLPNETAFLGALTAAVMEVLPLPGKDNLWIPVGCGIVMGWMR